MIGLKKVGYVGLIGLPNAGKSTLLNALIGEKISIVSRKPQTTRKRITGIITDENSQIIFLDAPGFIDNTSGLNSFLKEEFKSVMKESDHLLALLNIDCTSIKPLLKIIQFCVDSQKTWSAIITKCDLHYFHRIEKLKEHLSIYNSVSVFTISAVNSKPHEIQELLLPAIKSYLPEQQQTYFEDDIYTTHTEREIVAEIIREYCYEYLHKELPYGIAVKTIDYKEESQINKIQVEIVVNKPNYVGMVIGDKGQTLKRIGASARMAIEKFLNKKIFLQTYVKCRKDWFQDKKFMKELGYVIGE